jgi:7-carboxy-7-deazaguanine synthase
MVQAMVEEIFASIQGEGVRVGERHVFVRFQGCNIRCSFCDTPAALKPGSSGCRAQRSTEDFAFDLVPNPISGSALSLLCERLLVPGPSRPVLSLTGGEPLLHHEFLKAWLPLIHPRHRTYLETNGICHEELAGVIDLIDIVSMDIKLPSAVRTGPYWDEHRLFLATASTREVFVKSVVTADTELNDIVSAAESVASVDRAIPFILQSASGTYSPGAALLLAFQETALKILSDVRVIPQLHKVLQLP